MSCRYNKSDFVCANIDIKTAKQDYVGIYAAIIV